MEYYIYSFEHKGWWKANKNGYTDDFALAGVYLSKEAHDIVADCNKYAKPGKPNEALIPLAS